MNVLLSVPASAIIASCGNVSTHNTTPYVMPARLAQTSVGKHFPFSSRCLVEKPEPLESSAGREIHIPKALLDKNDCTSMLESGVGWLRAGCVVVSQGVGVCICVRERENGVFCH
jgi:hypothetical protein